MGEKVRRGIWCNHNDYATFPFSMIFCGVVVVICAIQRIQNKVADEMWISKKEDEIIDLLKIVKFNLIIVI
jgi:hypothetical protein